MKPVLQDKFYDKDKGLRGNCLQAAVASLLELPLAAVPNFQDAPEEIGFWGLFRSFLKQRGFLAIDLQGEYFLDCYHLAAGDSPRGVKHSIIQRNGKTAHDPHPSGLGLLKVDYVTVLVPIEPARISL